MCVIVGSFIGLEQRIHVYLSGSRPFLPVRDWGRAGRENSLVELSRSCQLEDGDAQDRRRELQWTAGIGAVSSRRRGMWIVLARRGGELREDHPPGAAFVLNRLGCSLCLPIKSRLRDGVMGKTGCTGGRHNNTRWRHLGHNAVRRTVGAPWCFDVRETQETHGRERAGLGRKIQSVSSARELLGERRRLHPSQLGH
jgi:hypothetical protein